MKDLGATKKILGIEIHKDRKVETLYLYEKKYVREGYGLLWHEMPSL